MSSVHIWKITYRLSMQMDIAELGAFSLSTFFGSLTNVVVITTKPTPPSDWSHHGEKNKNSPSKWNSKLTNSSILLINFSPGWCRCLNCKQAFSTSFPDAVNLTHRFVWQPPSCGLCVGRFLFVLVTAWSCWQSLTSSHCSKMARS